MQVRSQRSDALEHRRRILQTAQCLFKTHGVDEVSMHQIAKSAGVGQGTLYRQYSDKGEICSELMNESFQQFKMRIIEHMESTAGMAPRERILYFVRQCLGYLQDKISYLCVVQQSKGLPGRPGYYSSPAYQFVHHTFASLVREQQAANNNVPAVDPDYAAHVMVAAISPHMNTLLLEHENITPEMLENHFKSLFIDPLFPRT